MTLGVDVSVNQPIALPWAAWVAGGLSVACVQLTHIDHPEGNATAHLQNAAAAGVQSIGCYHWLGAGGAKECRYFLSFLPVGAMWAMVDVEDPRATAQSLADFCAWWDAHDTRQLVLYGNNQLAAFVEARPELRKYGVWYADYGPYKPGTTELPLRTFNKPPPPTKYPAGLKVIARQFAGDNGRFPPYAGAIDLTNWDQLPSGQTPMPIKQVTGCLFGGHTQGNSSITPIYQHLKDLGVIPAIGITDEDGGKVIEWQAIGVPTRINRKHLPEEGPDHDFEAGGSGRGSWSADKKLRYQTQAVNLPYKASPTEFKATSYFQTLGNEWDNQDAAGWLTDLDLYLGVLEQAEQRSVHDKAVLMGISDAEAATLPPVRYALPVFNAGTPHHWPDYTAMTAHPLWARMASRGDIILAHEGIAFDQPFDYGENQPVDPGVPMAPGAGLVNFRIFNLLWLLESRGIKLNWAIGEWYDGRRGRGEQVAARVANMIRHDRLLAASHFGATCLGYCQYEFTNDPNSQWYAQDCTLLWQTPAWAAHMLNVKGRINGAETMPLSTAEKQAMQAQAATLTASINALVPDDVPHWKVGDVALANTNPLWTYDSPNGPVHDKRPPTPPGGPMITYDLNVLEVTPDGLWLKVAATPLWVKAADCKHK